MLPYGGITSDTSSKAAAGLVDREEAALEAASRHAQVQAPDPHSFGASEAHRVIEVFVEAPGPVAQGLGVVGAVLGDVASDEAGALEREQHAREVQRFGVGEDVALREGPGFGV